MLKKIVVIGPESTGKSTLCKQLAEYYQTLWCPEYAREYLLKYGTTYTYNDLLTIARRQIEREDYYITKSVNSESGFKNLGMDSVSSDSNVQINSFETVTAKSKLLFIDTDMYVMKVWCEFLFENCHQFIIDQINTRNYDLYLLCATDLPWIKDELREYPDLKIRQQLYNIYKDILVNQSTPWVEISGNENERLMKAFKAINNLYLK